MAQAIKKTDGNVLVIKAPKNYKLREVVEFGENAVGVAQTPALKDELVSVDTRGVYEFTGATDVAFKIGDLAKWDSSAKQAVLSTGCTMGIVTAGKLTGVAGKIEVKIG